MADFEVHTDGDCFICRNKTSSPTLTDAVKLESKSISTSSVHSLQYLSRYLKMDMRKVFDEEDVVPPDLLAKVEKARLKVELCESCASFNKSFSKLYRRLEKVEMELVSHVSLLHKKLGERNETPTNSKMSTSTEGLVNGKLKIAKVLREEAKKKCLQKLKAAPGGPKVKMQNWSKTQLHAKMQKIRTNSRKQRQEMAKGSKKIFNHQDNHGDASDIINAGVKEEYSNSDPLNDVDGESDRDNFDDCDYYDGQNEEMELSQSPYPQAVISSSLDDDGTTEAEVEKLNIAPDSSSVSPNYVIKAGRYYCKLCSKSFRAKPSWLDHYKNIHLKIRIKCNLCGMEFTQRSNYKRHHQSIHLGMKFKCLVCSKTFSQKGKLVQHQRTSSCKTKINS